MANILVIHGPNLNLLGTREPTIYGSTSLDELNQNLQQICLNDGHQFQTIQSNAEHEIVDAIQGAPSKQVDCILINAAAYTHTSIAIRDALSGVAIPFYEIHISNVYAREAFRHHSYLSDIAQGVICGFGIVGYELALRAALNKH